MTDTVTISYRPCARFGVGGVDDPPFSHALRGIAVAADGRLYAVGDTSVKVYGADAALETEWATPQPGFSVAVDGDGRVWVGQEGQVRIFRAGVFDAAWADLGRMGLITAVEFGDGVVFLGDASARCIHRYDRDGNWLNDIGQTHRKGGFHIPNGVVDFARSGDGVLHVANPGMHRVERWTADGRRLGHFGRFDGRDPAGFPGCCNPTNLALGEAGRVIVTEKAGPRVKVYDATGSLLAVVAEGVFDAAAKNMDVAVDAGGRIYVADTATFIVHAFAPVNGEAAP